MSQEEHTLNGGSDYEELLDGFHYQDKADVLGKLRKFAADGPNKVHLVSDFDLTLTAGKRPGQNLGTWDVMDALMPPEGVARHTAIYQSFRPVERAGQLTEAMTREKWSETLDLITSYHMSIDDIEAAFLSVATLRPGAKELFGQCQAGGIPTVILSSGITNVIKIMADHYGLHPDYVLSNDLIVDNTRHISGWRHGDLIHILNKREMGHDELSRVRATRPNILLAGDVSDDVRMVEGDTDVIRVRVLDPRKGEVHDLPSALQASFEAGYDLVTEHSLQPLARIVAWLTERLA